MDFGSPHPFGGDSDVLNYETELVQSFWPMGFSNADSISRLQTLANYLAPKMQAAQNDLQTYMSNNDLTFSVSGNQPMLGTPYAAMYSPGAVYSTAQTNSYGFPALVVTSQGVAPGALWEPTSNIATQYHQLVGQVQDFLDRVNAVNALLTLYQSNNGPALAALNAGVRSVGAQTFWDVSDLPLQSVILAPVVTLNPISGQGQAVYDVSSIAAQNPNVTVAALNLGGQAIATDAGNAASLANAGMAGAGYVLPNIPGFTPVQATETAVQSATVQLQGSSMLVMLALGVGLFALLKK